MVLAVRWARLRCRNLRANNGKYDMNQKLIPPILKSLPLAIGCALLSACVSFGSAEAPPSLLVLSSDAKVADGVAKSALQKDALIIVKPVVPRKLDNNRIAVQIDESNIAYVKEAFWADKPARLMQSLLTETIAAKTGWLVLSEVESGGKAGSYLSGTLTEFGIDARTDEAVIIYDAVRQRGGSAVEKKRFEARSPVSAIKAEQAGAALNIAANKVANDIALWIAAKP